MWSGTWNNHPKRLVLLAQKTITGRRRAEALSNTYYIRVSWSLSPCLLCSYDACIINVTVHLFLSELVMSESKYQVEGHAWLIRSDPPSLTTNPQLNLLLMKLLKLCFITSPIYRTRSFKRLFIGVCWRFQSRWLPWLVSGVLQTLLYPALHESLSLPFFHTLRISLWSRSFPYTTYSFLCW